MQKIGIFWHRRDLRVQAPKGFTHLVPLYIHPLENLGGASHLWLELALQDLKKEYEKREGRLILRAGKPDEIILEIAKKTKATTVFWNAIWEPPFYERDQKIKRSLEKAGLTVCVLNDNYLIDPSQLLVKDDHPYRVFTPFYKTASKAIDIPASHRIPSKIPCPKELFSEKLTFKEVAWERKIEKYWDPTRACGQKLLAKFAKKNATSYAKMRDFPAEAGTSKLSAYLHFGQITPAEIWQATEGREVFLRQLFWREFSNYFLFHFPKALKENWNKKFDRFPWNNSRSDLSKWQKGQTGFPIVDAGMRQLWETGWMHNRVRMIVASFLTKDLLIDWREGEKWFWDTLVDADKPNNVMGWQWVAGCGLDAAPYFRIFNPLLQGKKFDPQGDYVRQYVPELKKLPDKWIHNPSEAPEEVLEKAGVILGKTYPKPMINHQKARDRALKAFRSI